MKLQQNRQFIRIQRRSEKKKCQNKTIFIDKYKPVISPPFAHLAFSSVQAYLLPFSVVPKTQYKNIIRIEMQKTDNCYKETYTVCKHANL